MNRYDCTHQNPDSLERELLFKEVMKLRIKLAEAEEVLIYVYHNEKISDVSKRRIAERLNFLNIPESEDE